MKCPNCGHDMQVDHLICEECGYEIQIVPDFDPNLDSNSDVEIDKSTVENELDNQNDISTISIDNTDTLEDITSDNINVTIKHRLMVIIPVLIGTGILIGLASWIILRMNSLEYQLNNVRNLMTTGKYESAISSLENIYVTHPNNSEILFLEADCYEKLGKLELAGDTLLRIASSKVFDVNTIYSAYDKLISLYDSNGDYNSINDLLINCEYSEIVNTYQNYMAMAPMFSDNGGEFEDTVLLKISANTSGTIYYTLDGTVPNDTSFKYDSPIALDHGEYIVSAIFVNQYGIYSDMVTQYYNIISDIPSEPIVNAASDSYEVPVLITVEIPENCKVYYTTDKSVPTEDSVIYRDPIPMPIGYSNFSFIAINEQGLTSDVVVKSYHLTFPQGLSINDAVQTLKQRLVERGQINDMNGTSDRAPGRYTYEVISAIPISGQGDYYTIREFYHDGTGNVTPTDTTYIVEIYQGSTAILGGDAVNGFLAIAF